VTELIRLLLLVPLLAQRLVRSVFRRYRAVRNHAGLAGAQVARLLLDAHGLQRVEIQPIAGFLTDNYALGVLIGVCVSAHGLGSALWQDSCSGCSSRAR
jgi:Zn-dependent membrane protease YugP